LRPPARERGFTLVELMIVMMLHRHRHRELRAPPASPIASPLRCRARRPAGVGVRLAQATAIAQRREVHVQLSPPAGHAAGLPRCSLQAAAEHACR
jgi:hypothetical protein